MRIAITGCSGSIGKRVVRRALAQNFIVVGIDNNASNSDLSHEGGFSFIQVDLTNYEATLKAIDNCEGIVHLAAIPQPRDYGVTTHNCNVVLSWNVLRAAAELGINHVVLASSVNVITLAYCQKYRIHYFPIDEEHPCEPDEPYGLSKIISEIQADGIVRRYPSMKVASLRFHWSVPSRAQVLQSSYDSNDPNRYYLSDHKDLWGYVQEDSAADACLLALAENSNWDGHERFFIAAPQIWCEEDSETLRAQFWSDVPVLKGKDFEGRKGFFDCSKAERLLGWRHQD